MNKIIITILIIATMSMTACEIPEMCFHGNKIGWDQENESHFSLRMWDCEEDTPIIITENISSNITIPMNISENITTNETAINTSIVVETKKLEIISTLDLTGEIN